MAKLLGTDVLPIIKNKIQEDFIDLNEIEDMISAIPIEIITSVINKYNN